MEIAILHPGRMGAAVGGQAARNGTRVLWCPAGRSEDSARRADANGLEPVADLADLLAISEIVISLCPPAAVDEVAEKIRVAGYRGTFVKANAISPQRVRAGANKSRLYMSGPAAEIKRVQGLFAGTDLEAVAIDGEVGDASALKMAFAAHQKASGALAAVSHALADAHGVGAELTTEARRMAGAMLDDPDYLPSVAARAWRWAPEMLEAAETLRAAGLPDDMARAAAAVFARWNRDKDDFDLPLAEVLNHLRD